MRNNETLYLSYGAHELKATYQRNMIYANLLVVGLITLILAISWMRSNRTGEETVVIAHTVIRTVADLGPPPTVVKKPPQVKVAQAALAKPKVGIPKPVADDEVLDEDVMLATREELAEFVVPSMVTDEGAGGIVVDIAEEDFDYIPTVDEFVPAEFPPEMIYSAVPDYPHLAKQTGMEGRVWIRALVYKDGTVRDAVVAKSSGIVSLDEAALRAAKHNRFKPGIQNGSPISVWVTYKVDFVLDQSHS